MLKLYRFTNAMKEYWETWDNHDDSHILHWGQLGTTGQTKTVKSTIQKKAEAIINKKIDSLVAQGFRAIDIEDHAVLLIEYAVDDMGTLTDIDKRHRLETRMNETLGWTGLGACDGGSIGSGTMEVRNLVVDFEIAKAIIVTDLAGTEFADFTRIYNEKE